MATMPTNDELDAALSLVLIRYGTKIIMRTHAGEEMATSPDGGPRRYDLSDIHEETIMLIRQLCNGELDPVQYVRDEIARGRTA